MSSFSYGFILSLLLIVSSWLWLRLDSTVSVQQQDRSSWGQIYERENQVYIQTQAESGWHIARIRTSLTSKTINIQSQNSAFLSILFSKKRGRLEIGENSDVFIHIQEDTRTRFSCEIEVKKGDMYISLFGTGQQTCHLKWRGNTIAYVKNADITIRLTTSEMSIYAHRGQVVFFNKEDFLYKDMWARVTLKSVEFFNDDFFILTPFANDRVLQSQGHRTRFKWTHVPENATMQLWVGTQRNHLRPVWSTPISSSEEQGYFRFPLGIYYWQMTATVPSSQGVAEKEYASQVYKIFIKPEVRPILTFPKHGFTKFVNGNRSEKYKFVWLNTSRLENLFIEIAKDSDFLNIVLKKPAQDFGFMEFFNVFPEGQYFWRVSGFRHNSSELLRSHVRHFTVVYKNSAFQKVKSWPKDGEKIYRLNLLWKESKFVWDAFSGFQNIRLHITNVKSQNVQEISLPITGNRVNIPRLSLGVYQWKIQGKAYIDKNEWVDITEPKKIEIIPTLSLDWRELRNRQLTWTAGPNETDHYVILIRRYQLVNNAKSSRIIVKKVKTPQWTIDPSFSDLFSIKIIAVNSRNQTVAISRERDFILDPISSALKLNGSSRQSAF